MRRALVIAIVLVTSLLLAAPATPATPTERKLASQIKVLQKEVRTLKKQMRDVRAVAAGTILFSACNIAATADAFQGTWEIIDRLHAPTDTFPPQQPIADPLNSCNAFQIQRQPTQVPPSVSVFSALLNIFR